MDTAYVICGKTGDVLSGLAIAQQQSENVHIVTSEQYAPTIQDVPGVTVHTVDTPWDDLKSAIKFAKQRFKKVLVPQTFGIDFPIKHTRPSFQQDQAARCGGNFESSRLKLPRPDNVTGLVAQYLPAIKNILIADHSESSPFEHIEDLVKLVQERFKDYNIVRLSTIKLPNFRDFLALYDAANAIITIDTAHLHLSAATETPVLALTYDNPHRWRGSAWHPRFKFYCRYGDYQTRKEQLVFALQMALEGRRAPDVTIIPMAHENAYNASIARFNGSLVRAYRYHPDKKLWPTQIAIDGIPVQMPEKLRNHSIDDPRLLVFNGKLHVSYVAIPYPVPPTPPAPCVVGYGEVELKDGVYKLLSHNQPRYGKNDLTAQEKNWSFFEYDGDLHFTYKSSPDHEVVRLENGMPAQVYKTQSPKCSFGDMRGGTVPIPYNGQLLRFFHTLVKTPKKEVWWAYYVGAYTMEPEPPFRIISVSKNPILTGDERYFQDWKFYKPNVTICYGSVEAEGGWRVSVGLNDSCCADVIVTPEQLHL